MGPLELTRSHGHIILYLRRAIFPEAVGPTKLSRSPSPFSSFLHFPVSRYGRFQRQASSTMPTSAKEAARQAAEAKARAAMKAAAQAEARQEEAKLKKIRAAVDKKLSVALLMAAAEGTSRIVWKDDQSVLPTLSRRGLWVYEQGVFSEFAVAQRLIEWGQYTLDFAMRKWTATQESRIQISDSKALIKLFGGKEAFEGLHQRAWELFFEKIGDEDEFGLLNGMSPESYDCWDLVKISFEKAWWQAVRRGEIDPEMAFESFRDYGDVYGESFLADFELEAHRVGERVSEFLNSELSQTVHVSADCEVSFGELDYLSFDYVNRKIVNSSGNGPGLVRVDKLSDSEQCLEMSGAILHPSIYSYFNPEAKVGGKIRTLRGVESLVVFWLPIQQDWLPYDDTVDVQTLSWLGGRDGKRFCRCVFGLVESAAQQGQTQVELLLTQLSSCWTLAGDDDISHYSLPPTLLGLMLSGYGYKVKSSSAGKKHRLVITW